MLLNILNLSAAVNFEGAGFSKIQNQIFNNHVRISLLENTRLNHGILLKTLFRVKNNRCRNYCKFVDNIRGRGGGRRSVKSKNTDSHMFF